MMKKAAIVGLLAVVATVSVPTAQSQLFNRFLESEQVQGITSDECRKAVVLALAKKQRQFRAVLYGYPLAEDASIGTLRYDVDGVAWIKTTQSQWTNANNDTLSNSAMQNDGEFYGDWPDGRRGYFETRRILTSEMVPYLAQAARTLQCQTDYVCAAVDISSAEEGTSPTVQTVQPAGCLEVTIETIPACHFGELTNNQVQQNDSLTFCRAASTDLLNREADIMKLAVEYDAAYRSLLQFSGNFDMFIDEFRWPLTFTIRQAAGLIGQLNRIPCFLSSCDDVPIVEP